VQKVATSRVDEVGAEAQYLSGAAYAENKEWQNAITAFLRVRYVFPGQEEWLSRAYLGLGQAYEELKDPQKAKEAYQNALKLQKEGDVAIEASRRLKALEEM
jgi:tetratricopeptide (TPR) repeat protein